MRAALDKNNRCIHISKAIRSETYYCPLCQCPMQVRNKNGIKCFDVAPGTAHAASKCKVPRYRFSDLWETSSNKLINDLLYSTANLQSNLVETKSIEHDADKMFRLVNSARLYSVVPFRYLSDFRKESIYTWPADTVLNGYRLTDLFVSRNNADVLMRDNDPLGFRIVDVKFRRLIAPDTLRFALYSTSNKKKIRFFDLRFEDQEEYEIMRHEVFANRNSRYYIAAVWNSSTDCETPQSGEWEIIGIQSAVFTNANQLYRYRS